MPSKKLCNMNWRQLYPYAEHSLEALAETLSLLEDQIDDYMQADQFDRKRLQRVIDTLEELRSRVTEAQDDMLMQLAIQGDPNPD